MGEDAGEGDVGRFNRIRITILAAVKHFQKIVHEVGVGAAVAAALGEGEVFFSVFAAVNAAGGEGLDFLGQAVGVIWRFDFGGDFRFGFFGSVEDERLAFDEGPFDGFFGAVNFDRFAVLARDVEEGAVDVRGEIGVFEFDVGGLDREGGVVKLVQFFTDGAGGETGDVFRFVASEAEGGADAVGGVMHGGHAFPVVGPAVHVLLVGGFDELQFAEFAFVVQVFHVEEFARVNDGFHHHVFEAAFFGQFDDFFAVFLAGGHGNGAGDVFAGFQGGQ